MQKLPYLSEDEIAELLSYEDLIPLMHETLVDYSAGKAQQPVRKMLEIEKDQRYLGIMPAATTQAMGAKLVAFYPKNADSKFHTHMASILLFDPEYGSPLAVMDGRLITEMRTAATSAAVTRVLADPQSKVLALIGSGVQAHAHLKALGVDFKFEEVRVWSRNPDNAQAFARATGAIAMSAEAAVRDADIVVTATSTHTQVVKGKWLKPGSHINAVGSPRPNWRELDDESMANRVVVDCREATACESGDIILSGTTAFAEAGEVLSGRCPLSREETTIFKSVGIAVEDLASARLVYNRFSKNSDC